MQDDLLRATRRSTDLPPAAGPDAFTVRVQNVQHYYGQGEARRQVLHDNTLAVARGEILIMSGPSGSGKTTLLTLIGTLRTVQEGSLQLLGQELRGAGGPTLLDLRRRLGFIFQNHNLFESLTAFQNISMAAELFDGDHRQRRRRIEELLDRLGLGERAQYKPGQLSGGQKQRVAVARGLVHRPQLVLADEPTAALDEQSGRAVMDLIQEMVRRDGTSVIVITHDNRILDFADRIVNMVDGRIKSDVLVEEAARICEYLQMSDIFSAHAVSTLTEVADKMLVEPFEAGQTVIRQGDAGDKFYLIRQGAVDVVVEDAHGRRKVDVIREGSYFGETALLTDAPRNATIVTTEPCLFYTLGKEDFRAVVDRSSSFHEELRRAIFDRQ